MKHLLKSIQILSLLAFVACSNEDDALPAAAPPQTGTALEITVRAGDFAEDGAPGTRATDSGKTTTFENGDRIGIIILDANGNILANNIPYQYDGSAWSFDSGNGEDKSPCYYYQNATYIAYFPYSPAADGMSTIEGLKDKFQPRADQRTENAYRASDLMTSGGSLSGSAQSVTLTHAYASVSLVPKIISLLDDGQSTRCEVLPKISDVNLMIGDDVYIAYPAEDGSYRCILSTGFTSGDIRCFYTVGSKIYGNTINISGAVAANTRYTSAPEINNAIHTLDNAMVGDFYCKRSDDKGYLIPGDAASLTDAQKKACVGVVFWVGDATAKDNTLQFDHSGCTHGLVVALKDAIDGTTVWRQSSMCLVQNWLDSNRKDKFLSVASGTGASDPLNNIQGYNNTKAIEAFNADNANSSDVVQAVQQVVDYRNAVSAPTTSSDWYLPSEKELTLLCGRDVTNIWTNYSGGTAMRDFLNGANGRFNKLGSSYATTIQYNYYWSSTEYDEDIWLAFDVNFDGGNVYYSTKNHTYRVRCVLAF